MVGETEIYVKTWFKAERPAFILNHETLRKQLNTFQPWLPHLENEWNNSHNNEEDSCFV